MRVVVAGEHPPFRHQVLALTLVELLGRLHTRIEVICAATAASPLLPPGAATLHERLEEARRRGHGPQETGGPARVTVLVGRDDSTADVHVDAFGWQTYVGSEPSRLPLSEGPPIAVGPACAAARAAVQVFQSLLTEALPPNRTPLASSYWGALDYQSSADPLDSSANALLEPPQVDAVLVGAGSVGGAAIYLLAMTPDLDGSLTVVDPQALEERNYVRGILASRQAAQDAAGKAEVAANALAHLPITANGEPVTIRDFVASRPGDEALPLILCAVDSVPSRREIQDALPLELINAACNESEATVSGHVTDDGPCVYCLHIEKVLDREQILIRLIARATGMAEQQVTEHLIRKIPLDPFLLKAIENKTGRAPGSLEAYAGHTVDHLYRAEFVYGEVRAAVAGGTEGVVAVAAPFITALAGFLLAGEALKSSSDRLARFRLGPRGELQADGGARATKYQESLFGSTASAYLMPVPRWPGNECLCRSAIRLKLLRERHGLES